MCLDPNKILPCCLPAWCGISQVFSLHVFLISMISDLVPDQHPKSQGLGHQSGVFFREINLVPLASFFRPTADRCGRLHGGRGHPDELCRHRARQQGARSVVGFFDLFLDVSQFFVSSPTRILHPAHLQQWAGRIRTNHVNVL